MGELSIKIRIGDRDYPMKVSADEEESIRLAGRMINERMKYYREQFGIDDKQDLLAMVAFDSLVQKTKSEMETTDFQKSIDQKLSNLDEILSSALSD